MHRLILTAVVIGLASVNGQTIHSATGSGSALRSSVGKSPLRGFEAVSPNVFVIRLPGVRVEFSSSRVGFTSLDGSKGRPSAMTFAGSRNVDPKADTAQSWPIRYIGPAGTRLTSGTAQIVYPEIYPHTDLVWFVRDGKLEYDWIVRPGGDPDRIRIRLTGAGVPSMQDATTLRHTLAGLGVEEKLLTYQATSKGRHTIASTFTTSGDGIGFRVGPFDRTRDLIIDPALQFLTYVGGSGAEDLYDIQFDSQGYLYLAGGTTSASLPFAGSARTPSGGWDSFIAKLNPTTLQPLFLTYYGGSGNDFWYRLRVTPSGLVWATGTTLSPNLPPSPATAYQPSIGGGVDAFLVELSATGQLMYSTYFGGNSTDAAYGIDVDDQGSAYITGFTLSSNFPLLNFAYSRGNFDDAFVAKFTSTGTLAYSTCLSGSLGDFALGVNVLPDHSAIITGYTSSFDFPRTHGRTFAVGDAFVLRLASTGNSVIASALYGGSNDDQAYASYLSNGFLYITGYTTSTDFPVTPNAFQPSASGGIDNFLLKVNLADYSIAYASYIGGNGTDYGRVVTATPAGVAIVGGSTNGTFPSMNPLQPRLGPTDGYVVVVNTVAGNLLHSTPIGTNETSGGEAIFGLQTDSAGRLWVAGGASGPGLATTPGALQTTNSGPSDGLLMKYADPIVVVVTVNPATAALYGGQTRQFSATLTNSTNQAVTWSLSGAGAISLSGLYTAPPTVSALTTATVTATAVIDGTTTGTATVTLYPPAAVSISPSAVPLYGGQSRQFSATVTNATIPGVTWTLTGPGAISPSGLYTAPPTVSAITTATITARSVADTSKTATATVTLYPPAAVSVSPSAVPLYGGQSQQFSATVTNATIPGVTWTLTGPGAISPSGLYTAPSTVSAITTATITARSVADTSKTAAATVTLYPPLIITVTPATVALLSGQTRQFTATVTNAPTTLVNWTVTGGGTITAAGLYTAPATVGATTTATVTATAVADPTKSAIAVITLRNPGVLWKPVEMLLWR